MIPTAYVTHWSAGAPVPDAALPDDLERAFEHLTTAGTRSYLDDLASVSSALQ